MRATRRQAMVHGAALAAALATVRVRCAAADAMSVRIVTGLRATVQSIAWIGTQAGVFKKHGIEAAFPQLEIGGPQTVVGLLAGDWEFAQTGTVPIAEAVLQGKDAVILLRNHDLHVGGFVMTRHEITSLKELDGKKVGVLTDAYSGQTGVRTRLAIEKAGAKAVYVGLGTFKNIYAALAAGTIDGGALPVDYRFAGQRQYGWNAFEAGSDVPSIFATTRRLIAADRDRVLRVVRGFVETIHLFKTRPDVVVPLLQEFLQLGDRQAAEDLRAFYAPLFPAVPRASIGSGMAGLRTLFATRYPAAATLQESDIVDDSIIDEIDRSGFIAKLYAADPAKP